MKSFSGKTVGFILRSAWLSVVSSNPTTAALNAATAVMHTIPRRILFRRDECRTFRYTNDPNPASLCVELPNAHSARESESTSDPLSTRGPFTRFDNGNEGTNTAAVETAPACWGCRISAVIGGGVLLLIVGSVVVVVGCVLK